MKKFSDDTFLARWLNNELSPKEKADFEASEDYKTYEKIIAGSSLFESPQNYDANQMLETILASKQKPAVKSNRNWIYGIAATIALLIISFLVYDRLAEVSYTAQNSEKTTVELPDGSIVIMNAGSALSHKRWNWTDNRSLQLNGEAFFDVVKGSSFKVETTMGSVTVLGTEFNVKVSTDYIEVACYEGSVRINTDSDSTILKAYQGYRRIQNQTKSLAVKLSEPSWINNESNFDNIPAEYVIEELEKQYDLQIIGEIPSGKMFTGSFPHDDQEVALKIVLDALQIDYRVNGNIVELQRK
ncbi:MAG: FecR domain-containing protein [Cyclobacteriaceae bacterium]|nr:FecR domain-containing protein [Cyclobacteriaceae bacterium SS2]